jgi:hypothetical protein
MHRRLRILVVATFLVILVGPPQIYGALQIPHQPSAFAVRGFLDPARRVYQGDNDNGGDNDDGDNDDGDNEDEDNDGGDNDNDEGDDNDNFEDLDIGAIYDELGIPRPPSLARPPSISAPARPPEPTCTTPGQDTVFTSHDDKVALRVFGSSPLSVQVVIYQVINAHTAPPPPGDLVGQLVYEVWASYCDANRVPEFPAEVNLGIRYSTIEVAGRDTSRFVIGRLDVNTATWVPVEKQANDPAANYVSATIAQTGYYMVWEAR